MHRPPSTPEIEHLRAGAARLQAGALLQALASLLWLGQAALLAMAVQAMTAPAPLQRVALAAAGVLVLGALRSGLDAAGARRVFDQARATLGTLRAEAAQALAARSPLDPTRPASGLAASVLGEQAEALLPYLARYQPARWRVLLVPPVLLLAVLCLSWTAALVLALAAPLIPLFMAIIGWRAKAASDAQLREQGGMNGFLLDRLRGLATLRALGAVDATAGRLRASAEALRRRTLAVLRIAFLSSAVLELFAALGVAMVAVYVGFHLLGTLAFGAWGRQLSLGEGLFILLLAPAFFEPLRELSAVWHDRAAGEAALDAVHQMTRAVRMLPGAGGGIAAASPAGPPSVRLRDLVFAHPGEPPLLAGATLQVAAGERVALFGPSGAGKSSLLALIAGLVAPHAGHIEIGGVPQDEGSAAALRARMAWLGQRPHVFAGSLAANVALGRPATEGELQAALQAVALGPVVRAHPAATLGEGGRGLSGGETVRLALARVALRSDADLLLVDEPTAHLDSATAAQVIEALLALARGRTVIVATHDPRLAARMDRVVPVGVATPEPAA